MVIEKEKNTAYGSTFPHQIPHLYRVHTGPQAFPEHMSQQRTLSKENIHGLELAAFAAGRKACSICKARGIVFTPSSVPHFKNHTQRLHGIGLRS
jgi:hypothetical protein